MSPIDERIVCRARLGDGCLHGQLMSKMLGEPGPMSEDGTYDGASVVCDSCYVRLIPRTPSGKGLHHELDAAIAAYPRG